jgi:hypothetical protein
MMPGVPSASVPVPILFGFRFKMTSNASTLHVVLRGMEVQPSPARCLQAVLLLCHLTTMLAVSSMPEGVGPPQWQWGTGLLMPVDIWQYQVMWVCNTKYLCRYLPSTYLTTYLTTYFKDSGIYLTYHLPCSDAIVLPAQCASHEAK